MTKARTSSASLIFVQAAVGSRDRVWLLVEEQDESRVLQLRQGKWSARTPKWPASSICGRVEKNDKFEVIVVGRDGEILIGVPGGFSESHVDSVGKGPEKFGIIRDISYVERDAYAVGMSRQVYCRRNGVWTDVAVAIRAKPSDALGFNSLHGLSAREIYAVGFNGEIWRYDSSQWQEIDSPTNVALNRVHATDAGRVYICGAAGVLLQGDQTGFALVPNTVTKDNLYGLASFRNRIYFSSLTGLYTLSSSGVLPVDTGIKGKLTFGSLDATREVMWSVGSRHLITTDDGQSWTQVFCDV